MKKQHNCLILITILTLFASGCATNSNIIGSFIGKNIEDLKANIPNGISKTYDQSYADVYNSILTIASDEGFKVYQSSFKDGYIVVITLPKQIDTTRIGIFFDSITDSKTTVTLSSLSPTALAQAEKIFLK